MYVFTRLARIDIMQFSTATDSFETQFQWIMLLCKSLQHKLLIIHIILQVYRISCSHVICIQSDKYVYADASYFYVGDFVDVEHVNVRFYVAEYVEHAENECSKYLLHNKLGKVSIQVNQSAIKLN